MRWGRLLIVGLSALASLLVLGGSAGAAPDLGYGKSVAWHLDGVPELATMEPTIREILGHDHAAFRGADGQPIEGFFPGATYEYRASPTLTPFYFYGRDTATILPMARYYYGAVTLRSTIEELLRLQYPDGSLPGTVSPSFTADKATVVSDEEASAIYAASEVYAALPDPAWVGQPLRAQPLVERLNRAMRWLLSARRDPETRLIKRGHTTDWGDVKWEPGADPTHLDPGDQWTASIYDQAIAYGALRGLVRLNEAAGRPQDATRWAEEADGLRLATDAALWQPEADRGFYRIHVHLLPETIEHDQDESAIVAIGNAAAVYYGLAMPDKVPRILAALERARRESEAPKPGLTLQPPYQGWHQDQMDQRIYQNGALWDWWAGRQVSAEFWSGYSQLASDHLLQIARDWGTHPGSVREWESPWKRRTGVEQAYAGAASVVGQAVVEGLFGVDLRGSEVRLTPRLGQRAGGVRVYEPATDLYVAYEYTASERGVSVQYGTNSPTAASIRLPVSWVGETAARLDGGDTLPFVLERTGEDQVAVVTVPSGTHRVELTRLPPRLPAL
ncbi:MAG TPA: hypothetical protein VFA49_10920 [Chloroflexota bacterium]|nr:hypothetical protein [Chloroflexota bacterium]